MSAYASITTAGFLATAITYGPARMGFGLYLNAFRSEFALSAGMAGVISSLGFAGFFASLPAAYVLAARVSPRTPVLIGLIAAAAGMALIAAAQNVLMLAGGAVLAMSSAGFSWAPFNAAVNRRLEESRRPTALSIVSTGTTVGIAAAALTALGLSVSGGSWRIAWAAFAGAGALAAASAGLLLRPVDAGRRAPKGAQRRMLANRAAPLHLLAFAFGAASTIYISFAGDRIERAGGLAGLGEGGSSALIFVSFGVAGLAGLLTGRVGKRTGLTPLLRMLFSACAASFALIALAPGSLAGVVASAALQGAFVMMISAALAFWSERLFPELPSMSFTAALLASAAGAVTGPVLAGFAVDAFGFAAMFLALAGASGLTVALVPPRLLPALQISAGGA